MRRVLQRFPSLLSRNFLQSSATSRHLKIQHCVIPLLDRSISPFVFFSSQSDSASNLNIDSDGLRDVDSSDSDIDTDGLRDADSSDSDFEFDGLKDIDLSGHNIKIDGLKADPSSDYDSESD